MMITRRQPIKRKRYAHFAFSAEAVQAYKDLRAIGDECTCPPKSEIPPYEGDHPDPADPRYRAFYSAPPPLCPTCESRDKAKTRLHLLAGIKPWERDPSQKLAALAAASGLEDDKEDEGANVGLQSDGSFGPSWITLGSAHFWRYWASPSRSRLIRCHP